MGEENIQEVVKEKYGNAALRVGVEGSSCCGASPAGTSCDPITSNLYDAVQAGQIPPGDLNVNQIRKLLASPK